MIEKNLEYKKRVKYDSNNSLQMKDLEVNMLWVSKMQRGARIRVKYA